ncbi:hypothetical protein [Vibrio sp.]|uniref:hypothetical protein n=1 Tax=Vibrio sp. TaxID=678 RepID=UPI00311E95F3
MTIKTSLTTLALLAAFNAHSYQHYAVFEDYVDLSSVQANTARISQIVKIDNNQTTTAAAYSYNDLGQVTQRDYVDSTLNYAYNSDGLLESAHALMKHGEMNTYVKHTKENFISSYQYNDQGQVTSETKQVFHREASDLSGTPIATYSIQYVYDENGKLVQRIQTPQSGDETSAKHFYYTYHTDGKLQQIREVKQSTPAQTSSLSLQYYPSGEIKKATQNLFAQGEKTIELTYINDASVYGPYYSDPVKEWKVDMDFFGLSFKPIETLKQTVGGVETTYSYQYQNSDNDSLADSLQLNVSSPYFSKQIDYTMTNQ